LEKSWACYNVLRKTAGHSHGDNYNMKNFEAISKTHNSYETLESNQTHFILDRKLLL
jgi:hypothetical protein